MKLSRGVGVSVLLLMCATQAHCTLGPGLSTPDERAKVVAMTRLLERDPLVENGPAARQWLREWIIEVPDIRVHACDDLLGHGLGHDYPYAREVNLQTIFSAAAFAIEHPDKARDAIAQYRAGVQGALRAYQALSASRSDARSAFLDDLLAMRDRGELADHVARLAKEKCRKPKTILLVHLAGAGVGLVLGLLVAWWFAARRAHRVASARLASIRQRAVFACAAYYAIVLTALHILEPSFDPRFRFMSEYALGRYGWLMTTTFFVLALATFMVAAGIRDLQPSTWTARTGFGLLAVAALFIALAGVFKDSIPHLLASAVVFPSLVMAVLLLSWSFRQAAGWEAIYRATLVIALGMLAAFLSMVADIGMPGLQQRAFIFLLLVWLSIVIHRSIRVRAGGA
jgi:hypothetical membrane protein